jgi:trimeric autotransporter adhesin
MLPNSGNMIQATSTSSAQYTIKATSSSQVSAGTLFHLQDAVGTDIVTFQGVRNFYYIVISLPVLTNGASYSIYTGGTYSNGNNNNGYYTGGTYSGGSLKKTFSVSGKVTSVSF